MEMSDLESPGVRDLAAALASLAHVVPMLVDQVGNVDKQALGTALVTKDISEMAFAACEAELRSMKAIHSLIQVIRAMVLVSPESNVPMKALDDATRELDAAEARITEAIDQVMARSIASESPP
jgi:hypothetical protein